MAVIADFFWSICDDSTFWRRIGKRKAEGRKSRKGEKKKI